eukprot:TRINITY_DN3982_c0_g1_i2.p1 TRINITY_DN3982_c0_g1~~TRINITY_DN3982_c0_g1_i2.p1  ORF type:complete len:326 (+),score=20.01 TRINITY_DN3982_c0_g1_i2:205-1182(+)
MRLSNCGVLASKKFFVYACGIAFTLYYIFSAIHNIILLSPTVDICLDRAQYVVHCNKFRQTRLAVVVPFLEGDSKQVAKWLGTFDTMKPCSEMCGAPAADLVFYHNRDFTTLPQMVAEITNAFESTINGPKCFKRMWFLSAKLNDTESFADMNMLWLVFDLLAGKYDYFSKHDVDLFPIRAHWVDALVNETLLPKFWIRGTVTRRSSNRHLHMHLLFSLSDDEFTKGFLSRVGAAWPGVPIIYAIGMYTRDAANWEYIMDHLDKFQYADFVQDRSFSRRAVPKPLRGFPAAHLVLHHPDDRCPLMATCKRRPMYNVSKLRRVTSS